MGVNRQRLAAEIRTGSSLLVDTCVLIAYLEGNQHITDAATLIIDEWVYTGRNSAFVSAISVMELLVAPLKRDRAVTAYMDFLQRFPNTQCVPVDIAVAQQAAILRARHNLRSPDALIVGTAVAAGADAIVTNDHSWSKLTTSRIVTLGDYALG